MKIFSSSLLLLLLVKLSSGQTFCDSAFNPCDSVSITSVTFIDDTIYGDKLIFSIQTNHTNLYAPNFILCPDDESISFEDPIYGFFSIIGPSEAQLLYYFTDFNITDLPELSGRIINDNSNNEFSNCEMSFNVVINGPDAIKNLSQENTIQLYPNPTNNEVLITSKDISNPIRNVVFMDLSGKKLNVAQNGSLCDITNLSAGIYLVEIELQNGNFVKKKLLKL